MTNPIQSFVEETGQTFFIIVVVILFIFIFATMGVAFGMEEFTNQIISSFSLGLMLILAIPPIGLIIGIFIWIKKATEQSSRI